jgi:hypothetical protein
MDRFRNILRKHEKRLLNLDNVVGVGLGYKYVAGSMTNRPAVMVFVKKKLPEGQLHRGHCIPRSLGEVDTDVIEVGDIQLLAGRLQKARPAQPGMSLGHYKITAGTFGALVRDEVTGEVLILSNNHVLANATDGRDGKSQAGDAILQPGAYDGGRDADVIAKLERFVPIEKNVGKSNCPIAKAVEKTLNRALKLVRPHYRVQLIKTVKTYNLVDAAVAKPINSQHVTAEILELGPIQGVGQAKIGLEVKKSGRTSGITQASIQALNVTMKVALGPGEEATFYDQILAGAMAQPGDSGSIVVDDKMAAVGLLFAGSDLATIINPIDTVLKLLKITL